VFKKRLNLRGRLVSLMVASMLPGILVFAYFGTREVNERLDQAREDAGKLSIAAADRVRGMLSDPERLLRVVSETIGRRASEDVIRCSRSLQNIKATYSVLLDMTIATPEGNLLCDASGADTAPGVAVGERGPISAATVSKRFSIGGFHYIEKFRQYGIAVAYPATDEAGALHHVVTAILDARALTSSLSLLNLPSGFVATFVDKDGHIAARHPAALESIGREIPELAIFKSVAAKRAQQIVDFLTWNGLAHTVAYAPVYLSDTGVLYARVVIDMPRLYWAVAVGLAKDAALVVGTLFLVIIAAWAGTRRLILSPVSTLTIAAEKLTRGDLRARTGLQKRTDELGKLAAAFDGMAAAMEKRDNELSTLALYDALTGIPSRANLVNELWSAIEAAQTENRQFCVISVELLRLDEARRALGYDFALKIVQQTARFLEKWASKYEGFLGRSSETQFTVVVKSDAEGAVRIARSLVNADVVFEIEGIRIDGGLCTGVAAFPGHGKSPEELLRHALSAAVEARAATDGVVLHSQTSEANTLSRLSLAADLRQAIRDKQLRVYYQPKITASTSAVSGFEALVRWQHPSRGLINPGDFISLAEYTGLIRPLTYEVLDLVVEQLSVWAAQGIHVPVAVNVSMRSLMDADTVSRIDAVLRGAQIPPRMIELEVTDATGVAAPVAREILSQMATRNIRVSISDFGTGFSSLDYLSFLPVHAVKLERSFTSEVLIDRRRRDLVSSIVSLAHKLQLIVIAEGVETGEQGALLRQVGCDELQGYWISPPLPAKAASDWLAAEKAKNSAPTA